MDQKYMRTIASNSLPVETDQTIATKVFTNAEKPLANKKRKTQRKRKLTLKRRKVR